MVGCTKGECGLHQEQTRAAPRADVGCTKGGCDFSREFLLRLGELVYGQMLMEGLFRASRELQE